jgi:hypothetical protein
VRNRNLGIHASDDGKSEGYESRRVFAVPFNYTAARLYVRGILAEFEDILEGVTKMSWPAFNAETSFADAEDLIIGWQTRRDLQRRGIVEVVEHD